MYIYIYRYIGCGHFPVTVVQIKVYEDSLLKMYTDLVVNVTGRGPHPKYIYIYTVYTCYTQSVDPGYVKTHLKVG